MHQVEHDENKDIPFLVMELISGESLEKKLKRDGRLSLKEIVSIGMQTAAGLAAAHEKGLIHRDIKPGNILLEQSGQRVKLTDFGLARAAEDVHLTRSGLVAGTPLYMSPEQASGEELDARSDLFSLGVVLYELAAGEPPFTGKTPLAVFKRVTEDQHVPLRERNPEIPEWFALIVDRLLAKKPADRFQSAREVADMLEHFWAMLRSSGEAGMSQEEGGRRPVEGDHSRDRRGLADPGAWRPGRVLSLAWPGGKDPQARGMFSRAAPGQSGRSPFPKTASTSPWATTMAR